MMLNSNSQNTFTGKWSLASDEDMADEEVTQDTEKRGGRPLDRPTAYCRKQDEKQPQITLRRSYAKPIAIRKGLMTFKSLSRNSLC
jgi:hypothetical protein